ncbi:MAG: DNA-binding FadR family transcriptional regulator [Pirellulaceae bacterium]|jgi:DNA-binding FadR family transcriptional regulator
MRTELMSLTLAVTDVVDLIKELIASRNLEHGERLPPIRALAVQFRVKSSMVRDALLAAQGKGLVKVVPRVGAIVQSTTHSPTSGSHLEHQFGELMVQQDQNLFHLLETREALEMSMVTRAAQRPELAELFRLRQILEEMASIPLTDESPEYVELDIQFHLELGRLSGNTVMTNLLAILMKELQPHLARIRWSDKRRKETNNSHARIYSALVAGDVKLAENEMRDHIRTAYNSLLDELRDPPKMNGAE